MDRHSEAQGLSLALPVASGALDWWQREADEVLRVCAERHGAT